MPFQRYALIALGGCLLCSIIACSKSPTTDQSSEANASKPAAKAPADENYPVVLLETNLGTIKLRLNREKAPATVDNFLSYVDSGEYNQTLFHQVHRGQGILGGIFSSEMQEKKSGPTIRNEADNRLKNVRGSISMVRLPDVIDSATRQFFINLANNPSLDYRDRTPSGYGYCVFGEVVEGLDVIDKIGALQVHDTDQLEQTPVTPVIITTAHRG